MRSKYGSQTKKIQYYLYNEDTDQYLGSDYRWGGRGALIPDMIHISKILRLLAEKEEEKQRPENWKDLPRSYDDIPAAPFIPDSWKVVNSEKSECIVTAKAHAIAQKLLIYAWRPTN